MRGFDLKGTPHTLHYTNSRDALLAGKHVLCEKPVTSNATELRSLLHIAREKNRFFMEALWTRFHPLTAEVKKISDEGSLGDPVVLHADLSGDFDVDSENYYLATNCRVFVNLRKISL